MYALLFTLLALLSTPAPEVSVSNPVIIYTPEAGGPEVQISFPFEPEIQSRRVGRRSGPIITAGGIFSERTDYYYDLVTLSREKLRITAATQAWADEMHAFWSHALAGGRFGFALSNEAGVLVDLELSTGESAGDTILHITPDATFSNIVVDGKTPYCLTQPDQAEAEVVRPIGFGFVSWTLVLNPGSPLIMDHPAGTQFRHCDYWPDNVALIPVEPVRKMPGYNFRFEFVFRTTQPAAVP